MEYDTKEDKFVGFVLPPDLNGMPIVTKFQNIEPNILKVALLSEKKSNYLYTIMAQPLQRAAPSFCLCVYGTNNSFTADVVQKRFNFIVKILGEAGINVHGWSSDGDSRLLTTMKKICAMANNNSQQNVPEIFREFFFSNIDMTVAPIQDCLHIITKLRNNLVQTSSTLRIGKHIISIAFLQNLVNTRPKGEHGLSQTDIDCNDRMNVTTALRLFQPNVISLLEFYYPQETKGLVLFLTLMRNTYDAFDPFEQLRTRLFKIWYNVFILRTWKHSLKKEKKLKGICNCKCVYLHGAQRSYAHKRV